MSRSDSFNEHGVHPLAPFEEALNWLLSTGVHVTLGVAIGVICAVLIRSCRLHWSWATAGLLLAPLLAALVRTSAALVDVVTVTATALGRRWHRAELDAGRDLRELALARRTVLDVLAALRGAASLRLRMGTGAGWFRGEQLIIGRDERGAPVAIPLGSRTTGSHTLVLGATGSGKTMTECWIAARAVERGMGAIVVDPKGDAALREAMRRTALAGGREFIEWSPDGPSVYNPYARGSDTEIADKALAGERFTEPHYLRQAQRYIGHVVRALRSAGSAVSLPVLVEQLEPGALERTLRSLPEDVAQESHTYLDSLTARQQRDLSGVRDRLAILAESDLGRWLDPRSELAVPFDLLAAVRARAVVYFGLEADSRPLVTQMLGAAIVQDLQTVVAALQSQPLPTVAVIDEFSALSADQVVRLFGRARSAGVSLVLGTQELADLKLPARERVLEQVMGNLSVLIAHRQVLPESCALIASLAGTRGAWRTSRHSDGRTTRSRTAEGVLAPDRLLRLPPGCAAVTVLTRRGAARVVRVLSDAGR
jgi:TraM recognition site of TraD and TraG/Type IV secretion-system coupling protein DNA-binding domain